MATIYMGSDPWAGELHAFLAERLRQAGHAVVEVNDPASPGVPYYEVARRLAVRVCRTEGAKGIVMCGTGMGVNMVSNKFPGISCAVCENTLAAHRARAFNNANVLALGAYMSTPYVAWEIVQVFLNTPFADGVDPDRAEEILSWHREVHEMEEHMFHCDWQSRFVPEAVPPVETEARGDK